MKNRHERRRPLLAAAALRLTRCGMPRRLPAVAAALVVLGLAATGCASSSFDRHFDARRWDDAARVFAEDSALHANERSVYRAAIVYATPATSAYDPVRARELLERLLAMEPRSPRAVEATTMLALLYEVQRQQDERMVRERETNRRITELSRELAMLEEHVAWIEQRQAATEEEAGQLRELAASLTASLRDRDARLRALQQELDRLKEIDLNPPPRPPAGNATNPDVARMPAPVPVPAPPQRGRGRGG